MLSIDIFNLILSVVLFLAIILLILSRRNIYRLVKLEEDLTSSRESINYHLLIQSLLLRLTRSITTGVNQEEILDEMIKITKKVFSPDAVSIMLKDEVNDFLKLAAYSGLSYENVRREKVRIGEKISGFVAKNRKPLLIKNGRFDFSTQKIPVREEVKSAMCVPLVVDRELLGVISVSITKSPKNFTENDLKLFETFSNELAIAIKNYKLITSIKKNFVQTLRAFAAFIDAKDKYTKNHSKNVSNIAGLIACNCGLNSKEVEQIMIAGLLHDVGKIGIPDGILNKNGTLDEHELEIVKKHPLISSDIVGKIEQFKTILSSIIYHHERWDGKGYPSGLKGKKIPIGARIIAIADAYDAITTDRPYRKALNREKALAEIKRNAGCQFDPELVEIFLKII